LEVDATGRYGSILVSQQMFRETNAGEDLIDGFINYPRGVDGVEVAIQFRELDNGQYKVSFRSRGNVNVAAIAERLGGGGHFNAAGCTLTGSLDEVRTQIFDAVESSLKP
jgi:bifunctional oligoribonuclease and PAP phosphatase NrnA